MKRVSRLWSRMFPVDHPDNLSDLEWMRFNVLLKLVWFGLLMLLIITVINLVAQKYDRVVDNLIIISAFSLPTLWLLYRSKIRFASWYFLVAYYFATVWWLYARIAAHADVHMELHFLLISLFAIFLLDGNALWVVPIFLIVNYLAARAIVNHYLQLPVEIGQFVTGGAVFIIVTYLGLAIKKTLLQMQEMAIVKTKELSDLNALKDKLFGVIGHDLRSPIATLKIQLMDLKNGNLSVETFEQNHGRLLQMVDSVYITLDNLLHWSLIQRSGLHVRPTHFDLSEIVESVLHLYETECQAKQLTVTTNLAPTPIIADDYQLHIVVRNLLQNAIKFTPKGGHIRLATRQTDSEIMLVIEDSGIGMVVAPQQVINGDAFPRNGTIGEKSTGLGLPLARELVQINGGLLSIRSELGVGTAIEVRFPMQASHPEMLSLK